MKRRLLWILPGVASVLAATALGTHPAAAAAAIVLYLAALVPAPRTRAAALLAAPIALSLGAQLPNLLILQSLAWLAVALAAVAPLFLTLGASLPWRGLPVYVGGTLVLLAPLLFIDWAPTYFTSDLAPRAQVALVAAAVLLLSTVPARLRTRRAQRAA
jgi:hypothetical protein